MFNTLILHTVQSVCVIQLAVYGTFGAKALNDISKALDQDVSGPSTVSTSTMPTTTNTTSTTTASTTSTTSTTTTSTTSATKPNKAKRSAVTPPYASQTSSTLTPEELNMKVVSLPIYMIAVVLSMVGLVSNSLLIHGVSKEREGLVVFWLVWMGLDLLLELVELVWNAYMSQGWFAHAEPAPSVRVWMLLAGGCIIQAESGEVQGVPGAA
eukprot:GFUD01039750.1.p1 GENE.GFUD01039750.1~~GFUD01039750.1.p1  ORF type:complete len:211 (-),score=59.79 GFUD01039750.1:464-1096(-)